MQNCVKDSFSPYLSYISPTEKLMRFLPKACTLSLHITLTTPIDKGPITGENCCLWPYHPWMYNKNRIHRRRQDPVHSYESCSVAHEAGRAGYFWFSPLANLNGDKTIELCGSSRHSKCGWTAHIKLL